MTTPNIETARDRLNKSIAAQQKLRRRIVSNAAELRGDVENVEDAKPEIASEPAGRVG